LNYAGLNNKLTLTQTSYILNIMSVFSSIIEYFKASKTELNQVNWPNRKETIKYTILIIAISLAVSAFLGSLDYLFQNLINKFIVGT